MNTSKELELLLCHFEVNVQGSIKLEIKDFFLFFFKCILLCLAEILNLLDKEPSHVLDVRASAYSFTLCKMNNLMFFARCGLWHSWLTAECICTWSRPITLPVSGSTCNRENDFLVQWNKWIFFSMCEDKHFFCYRDWKCSLPAQSVSVISKNMI